MRQFLVVSTHLERPLHIPWTRRGFNAHRDITLEGTFHNGAAYRAEIDTHVPLFVTYIVSTRTVASKTHCFVFLRPTPTILSRDSTELRPPVIREQPGADRTSGFDFCFVRFHSGFVALRYGFVHVFRIPDSYFLSFFFFFLIPTSTSFIERFTLSVLFTGFSAYTFRNWYGGLLLRWNLWDIVEKFKGNYQVNLKYEKC